MGIARRIPIRSYRNIYKGIAELGFITKHMAQDGHCVDAPFEVLCWAFTPLIQKTIYSLSKKRIPSRDLEQEVKSTLYEAVLAFDWDRCRDANFFKFFSAFIRQRMQFIPKWRIQKETRELPKGLIAPDSTTATNEDSPHPSMEAILTKVEQELSPKHADLVFCLYSLRMTQADVGKVFGVTQKGVNWWWKRTRLKLKKILRSKCPD